MTWASQLIASTLLIVIDRVRICYLGWHFFPSKVVLDTLFLSFLWTKLEDIWYTYKLTFGHKSPKNFVHRQPWNLVSDGTFEAKKCQPKLKIRTLVIEEKNPQLRDTVQPGHGVPGLDMERGPAEVLPGDQGWLLPREGVARQWRQELQLWRRRARTHRRPPGAHRRACWAHLARSLEGLPTTLTKSIPYTVLTQKVKNK